MIKLDQQKKQLEVKDLVVANSLVFEYFNQKVPKDQYQEQFLKALYIGVLALMEDRLSAFLSRTQNELGTELEGLKMMFDLKQELFYKSTVKGTAAEEDVAEFLNAHFKAKKLKDEAVLTGNQKGLLPRNKTGDIVVRIDGSGEHTIGIECKFDKGVKLGDIAEKDVFVRKADTAWSQLLETRANRGTGMALIVFDRALVDKSILDFAEHVGFVPQVGFISIVDTQRGDYSNLVIAYTLARDMVLHAGEPDIDPELLSVLVKRLLRTIEEFKTVRTLVEGNIRNNQKILEQLEKAHLLMAFNQQYFEKLLRDKTLTAEDLLAFYMGDEVKSQFKAIEGEVLGLVN